MSEFLEACIKFENGGFGNIIFLAIFSCFVALFHTVILSGLYNVNIRPQYLLFILNPSLIIFLYFFHYGLSILAVVIMFLSVFVLGIIGMIIVAPIRSAIETNREQKAHNKRNNIPEAPAWKKILKGIGSFVLVAFFLLCGPLGIILIIAFTILSKIIKPSSKSHFLKLQSVLPASKIHSLAMGLAEVQGQLIMLEPLVTPIKQKQCIGYYYTIEEESTNSDGDSSYSTVFSERKYNPFYIEDETGKIKVNPEKLEFIYPDVDEQYCSYGKRYTQYLLKENNNMLIIGKVNTESENQPFIERDDNYNVFGIAPVMAINRYNKLKPLLNSLALYGCIFVFLMAIILIAPVYVQGNTITIESGGKLFNWNWIIDFFKNIF